MNQPLEKRVAALEKSLRLYRLTFAGLMITGLIFATMSFENEKTSAPDVIQAKSFQVVNDDGKIIAELNRENENGQLSLFKPTGDRIVSLFTSNSGSGGINTFDENGEVIFKVTSTTGGGGYMGLYNSFGVEVAELGVTNQESGYLSINDDAGDKLAWITYTQDGGGYFSLSNKGTETFRFSTPAAGGRMGIYNSDAKRIVYIGAQENKDGNLTIWNNAGVKKGSIPQ
jgi:hypothetical protein